MATRATKAIVPARRRATAMGSAAHTAVCASTVMRVPIASLKYGVANIVVSFVNDVLCATDRYRFKVPDPNNPGHYKANSASAECWRYECPGRFPAVLVANWTYSDTNGDVNKCIFPIYHPNHPCTNTYSYCR